MKRIMTLIGTVVMLVFAACSPTTSTPENLDWNDPANPRNVTARGVKREEEMVGLDAVVNYGNGVYYFSHTRAIFANGLSKFLDIHTNLEVTAMTGNVVRKNRGIEERGFNGASNFNSDYGAAVGYFVTFREKK